MQLQKTEEDTLTVALAGSWKLGQELPSVDEVLHALEGMPTIGRIAFDTRELAEWDSGLLIFLKQLSEFSAHKKITLEESGLPEGARKLLALAAAVPAKKDARKAEGKVPFLSHVGSETVDFFRSTGEMLAFIGDTVIAFLNLLRGRAQYRKSDLWLIVESCGGQALPIVSLICFLVGLILAFIGAIQLQLFGAQIYVADLVGIGMVRMMSPIMTGIIMAGRTGAAFAAQLGTMQVNEEIDAFRTLGISPMDFLVMPRMLALIFVMPLLTLYSDLVGMLAGLFVAGTAFDIGTFEYYHQTIHALDLRHFAVGISKGTTYGILIAFAGCLRGMQCGRSAQAVGQATTSAVVTSIVFIVVAASVMTILYQQLGI